MLKNLRFFWKIHLAVALGAALATAVLTGAMTVGDSVRGSLHDLTLQRLGTIDDALVASRFFRQDLADDIAGNSRFQLHFSQVAPAVLLSGSAVNPASQLRGSSVTIVGAHPDFVEMAGNWSTRQRDSVQHWVKKSKKQIFDPVVINQPLADQLSVKAGDQLLLYLQRQSDIHRESLFGSRDTEDVVRSLRLTVAAILPASGLGRFGLHASQVATPNAFVELAVLQKALDKTGQVNALFVSRKPDNDGNELSKILAEEAQLPDLGLKIKPAGSALSLESLEFVLQPDIANLVAETAGELGLETNPVYTYLANRLVVQSKLTPYSTVAAVDWQKSAADFAVITGKLPINSGDQSLVLGKWLADDLQVTVGDQLKMVYYSVDTHESLREDSLTLPVAAVVAMSGFAADRGLTPDFPGIQDAENIFDWDPPFPVNLDLIRDKDEKYWDDFRATPKAFIGINAGQKLWSSRFGDHTSLRITRPGSAISSGDIASLDQALRKKISPGQSGLAFLPVKEEGLAASAGATDFSQLFIGFSYFLIIAAALLVGLLFRLSVEQRAGEIGVLTSTGYTLAKIRRSLLSEGAVVAAAGCLLGLLGAYVYGHLMITGLRTLWVGATGTSFLRYHALPATFISGFCISLLIAVLAIFFTVWRLRKSSPIQLMRGDLSSGKQFSGKFSRRLMIGSGFVAIGLLLMAIFSGFEASSGIFFGLATMLLICGLSAIALLFAGHGLSQTPFDSLTGISMRNLARRPGRSMLAVALVASACFVIVAVGAYRKDFRKEVLDKNSGSGGFALVAESDIPVPRNLSIASERMAMDVQQEKDSLWHDSQLYGFRLRTGEDASCLNLYQPRNPRILGVPDDFVKRGGFSFLATIDPTVENPWTLLGAANDQDVVPGFADANSAQWIMHIGLGDTLTVINEDGASVRIRLVGLLATSIFQSEVLIAENAFMQKFPESSGYAYFLLDTPAALLASMTARLEKQLSDYGLDVVPGGEKLAEFHAVQNTYLSVFQALGGLGLLLGTIGLAIVIFRNVLERRGEFATLRAFGFRLRSLKRMLLSENALVILLGILLGSAAAIIAVLPHLLSSGASVPWLSLSGLMIFVFVFGVAASILAITRAMKTALLPALKSNT